MPDPRRKKGETPGRLNLIEDPAELARWTATAKAKGLSLSAWVRMVCRAAAGGSKQPQEADA
jgi:hypothetical protein